MADEPLSRVGKGDPVTADWANAVADAINGRGASDPNANGTATPYGSMTPADVDTQMRAPDAQAMPFDAAIVRTGGDDEIWMAIPSGIDLVRLGSEAVPALPEQSRGDATNAWVKIANLENGVERFAFLALGYPTTAGAAQNLGWRVFVDSSQSPANWPAWVNTSYPAILLASWNVAADDTSGTDTAPGDVPSLRKGLVQHHRGAVTFGGGAPVAAPMFLDVKLADVTVSGSAESHIFAYLGEVTGQGYPRALRVNGEPTEIDYDPAKLSASGWLDLGQTFLDPGTDENARTAVWLYPSSVPIETGADTNYEGATNWGATKIAWKFDTDGTNLAPGQNAAPQNAPTPEWRRWIHPVLVALIRDTGKTVMQCVHGGMDFTFDVPDADGTHTGTDTPEGSPPIPAGGFCSVEFGDSSEHGAPKQMQLYKFRTSSHRIAEPSTGGQGDFNPETDSIDLVAREHDGGEQGAVRKARVGYVYLPALVRWLKTQVGDDLEQWIRAHPDLIADILRDFDEDNAGPFWLSGGTSDTCFGNLIGNVAGTDVIDLANLQLIGGMWRTGDGVNFETGSNQRPGNLTVHGQASVNGQLVTNSSATIGGSLDITGASLDATAATAKFQEVQTTSLRVGGDNYVPTQIVLANGQTLTVLAKQ